MCHYGTFGNAGGTGSVYHVGGFRRADFGKIHRFVVVPFLDEQRPHVDDFETGDMRVQLPVGHDEESETRHTRRLPQTYGRLGGVEGHEGGSRL